MRKFILQLGHTRVTIAVTILLTLLSFISTHYIAIFFHIPMSKPHYLLAFGIPALIVPMVIWYIFKLYFTIEGLESKMRKLATFDSLTGLFTRYTFLKLGKNILEDSRKSNGSVVILYIDIDDFKQINDIYGHEGGDKVLAFWGRSLLQVFREGDIIGRVGGEEAAVILYNISLKDTVKIIHRMQHMFRDTHIVLNGNSISFTVSVGVALAEKNISLNTLLSRSDKALYHAKKHGKDCTYLFHNEEDYSLLGKE